MRSVIHLLLLSACIALLGPIQCLSIIGTVSSRMPSVANVHYSPTSRTREEVADKSIDLSLDARQESEPWSVEVAQPSREPMPRHDADVEPAPLRRLIHRKISPSSSDDAFHLT